MIPSEFTLNVAFRMSTAIMKENLQYIQQKTGCSFPSAKESLDDAFASIVQVGPRLLVYLILDFQGDTYTVSLLKTHIIHKQKLYY